MSELSESEARYFMEQEMGDVLAEIKDKGYKEGILENKRETALKMIKAGTLTPEQISEFSGLSLDEVKELKAYAEN